MSNKIGTVVVGNLVTDDPWADQFWVDLYYDAGFTQFVATRIALTYPNGSGISVQKDLMVFDGLELGHIYWLKTFTRVSTSGAQCVSPAINLASAGNVTAPVVTYTFSANMTPAGLSAFITPTTSNTDIDHYEYYFNQDASTPLASTIPTAKVPRSASGGFSVFCGSGPGVQYLWVRAINTTGIAQTWVNLVNENAPFQIKITVKATGFSSVNFGSSMLYYNDVAQVFSVGYAARSYNVVGVNKTTGLIDWFVNFDIWGDPTAPSRMYASLASNFANRVIVVYTSDEPSVHRLDANLWEAIASIGGSRAVYRSSNFKFRSSYILVGQNNLGEGNGIELYSGAIDDDPNVFCETTFFINQGQIVGLPGGATAALQINGASGQIASNGSIPKTFANAFSYTSTSSTITWSWNLNLYRIDGSVSNYINSTTAPSLPSATQFFFFPYVEDDPSALFFGQVAMVFQVPGAVNGVGGNAYGTFNYACVQQANLASRVSLTAGSLVATTTGIGGSGGGSSGGSGTCLRQDTLVGEKQKGLVPLYLIQEGDWLDSPDGWVRVSHISAADNDLWVVLSFEGSEEEVWSTPNHCWVTVEGNKKESSALSMSDMIPTKSGLTYPNSIRVVKQKDTKIRLSVDSADKLYYVGTAGVQTHNLEFMPC